MQGIPLIDSEKYISSITINGLRGRVMHFNAPSKKKREILLVYGHHASLERMYGLAKALNRYGSVTIPDMPGFGGMDSLYSIGKKPNIDSLAEYLAAFIKLRFKKRKITIIAVSLGFGVVTRMLQMYPSLTDKVELCVSAAGFTHHDDIKLPPFKRRAVILLTKIFSLRVIAFIIRFLFLQAPIIRWMYRKDTSRSHTEKETAERRKYRIEFEVWLWQNNDVRTHFFTLNQMLTMDLCNNFLSIPVYHVAVDADQYLDNHLIEQHMRVIYSDFIKLPLTKAKAHAPTIIATAREASVFIPPKLRTLLNQP